MKRTYSLFQKYTASVLLTSFMLQSCGGLNNSIIPIGGDPQIQTDPQQQLTPQLQASIQSLMEKTVTAQGGHTVTLYKEAGTIKADVEMNTPQGFSKIYVGLSVILEQGAELASLSRLNQQGQKHRVHLRLAKGNQPACIVIYKGAGLAGGMLEGEEEEQSEEEYDEYIESIPYECFCPITQLIIKDPVIAQDGHTYERAAIERWFNMGKRTSPKTGAILPNITLIDNHAMRGLIEDLKERIPILAKHEFCIRDMEVANHFHQQDVQQELESKVNLITQEQQKAASLEEKLTEVQHQNSLSSLNDTCIDQLVRQIEAEDLSAFMKLLALSETHNQKEAQYQLGIIFQSGKGFIKEDKITSFKWFEKAAEQGYPLAQLDLAIMYSRGEGVEKDPKKAFEWLCKAANQGEVTSQAILGIIYTRGKEVEKDVKKAFEWFEKAANQGFTLAQYKLGKRYTDGQGVEKDPKKALEWYKKAAEQGDLQSQYILGDMYSCGKGVEKDDEQAFKWYKKAAEKGYRVAEYILGDMYSRGKGVEKDEEQAFEWYKKAAEKRDVRAQCILGDMYSNGEGVEKNARKAVEWYQKAADQGNADALDQIKNLNKLLNK